LTALTGPASLLEKRRLYLCTPDRHDLVDFVRACISGGVDLVQLREKNLEARALVARAALVRDVCRDHGVPFILNDRPDLALDVDADGTHVGQDDASVGLARRILGPLAIVGLSTHSEAQLDESRGEAVDYVSAGPVVSTPTKPGREGTGLGYISYANETAGRPVFVTGGVNPESVADLVHAGARRFVVVRYLTESSNPRRDARRLLDALDAAMGTPA
jgi:thiamine-phosphate pyrophosphorylase